MSVLYKGTRRGQELLCSRYPTEQEASPLVPDDENRSGLRNVFFSIGVGCDSVMFMTDCWGLSRNCSSFSESLYPGADWAYVLS